MNPYEELRHAAETAVADLKTGVGDTSFIIRYLQRALKTPRRNCDVGTEGEQSKRFDAYCYARRTYERGCGDCPLLKSVCCELAWSQLPYEEGDAE